jgi:outer membrane protein OmpA-like peptidoglycan-associated protein
VAYQHRRNVNSACGARFGAVARAQSALGAVAQKLLGGLAVAAMGLLNLADPAFAQDPRIVNGEQYIPGIWIDPDGCEHWAMDDGTEGFMSPRRTRDGRPVCHRNEICGVMQSDQLFATDHYNINAAGRAALENFFNSANAYGFMIYGHTDSRASDEYNLTLSDNRANAVAEIAVGLGKRVIDLRGFGERQPVASNDTAEGMARNRRVEIYCLR